MMTMTMVVTSQDKLPKSGVLRIIYRVTYWNLEVNSVSKEAVCIQSGCFDLFEANIPLNETVTQYSAPTNKFPILL